MQAKRPVPLKQTETQGNNKRFGFPLHLVAARNVVESPLVAGIQVHQKGYIPTRIRKRLTALRIKSGLTFLFRTIELRLQRQIAQQVNARPGPHQVARLKIVFSTFKIVTRLGIEAGRVEAGFYAQLKFPLSLHQGHSTEQNSDHKKSFHTWKFNW